MQVRKDRTNTERWQGFTWKARWDQDAIVQNKDLLSWDLRAPGNIAKIKICGELGVTAFHAVFTWRCAKPQEFCKECTIVL